MDVRRSAAVRPFLRCSLRAISALLVAFSLSCGGGGAVKVLALAHGLDPSHPVHKAMEFLATRLDESSGGSLQLRIYPSEQLGSERECLELLQIGSLAMTKVSASVLESFSPAFRVLSLPFLFSDRDHVWEVLDGEIGRDLLAEPLQYRLRGLAFYDAGSRSFYTTSRPVRSPEDLQGLKIRTMESATAMDMVRALGGSPTPISWGEIYTALQQGVVDGAENNPPSFHLSRHYEVAKYYSLDEHTSVPDVLLIGRAAWEALDSREQELLSAAARESAEYQKILWRAAEKTALDAVQEAGVEVLRPNKQAFMKEVEELLEARRADPEVGPWMRRIQGEREN